MSKTKLTLCGLLLVVSGLAGCRQDMHDNPRYEAYEDGANRQYPAGVVARGSLATNPSAPAPAMGNQQQVQTIAAAPAEGVTPAAMVIPKGKTLFRLRLARKFWIVAKNASTSIARTATASWAKGMG